MPASEMTLVNKLKEEGNGHWNSPNTGATNETGFTALPGGNRRYETYTNQEIFCCLNRYGFFWSSSEVYTVNGQLVYQDIMSGKISQHEIDI